MSIEEALITTFSNGNNKNICNQVITVFVSPLVIRPRGIIARYVTWALSV